MTVQINGGRGWCIWADVQGLFVALVGVAEVKGGVHACVLQNSGDIQILRSKQRSQSLKKIGGGGGAG